ncbi:MAG TPA: ATP-dependent RecD-like DNA helicase, partial [Polyangiaceae bacterium]
MPTTLTGHVERVTYENEETSFRVIKLGRIEGPTGGRQRTIAVVGTFQAVGPGAPVRITGDFFEDPRYGEQFRASSLVVLSPDTLEGLEKYLGSGVISGIGPGYSKRIVRKFGMDTLTILDNQPDRLSEVSGLGERRVAEIKEAWSKRRASSNVMVLLQTHGASPSLAARIVERYGDRAAGVIQRSPYRLALDVHGVGFKTADKMARSLGISGDHPERAQAGVMHVLGLFSEQGGHVFAPRATL